jgi:hypothetical protein
MQPVPKGRTEFLPGLGTALEPKHSPTAKLRKQVEELSRHARASSNKRERRNTFYESAFLSTHIFGPLHEFVASWPGMDKEKARQALLVEGHGRSEEVHEERCKVLYSDS